MAKNRLTLKLDGAVPLELYTRALGHFTALVFALSDEIVGEKSVEWTVTELSASSAFAAVTGYAASTDDVERVVNGYQTVATSLKSQQMIPYSDTVIKEAIGITSVVNGKIRQVHFGIENEIASTIDEPIKYEQQKKLDKRDFGVVEGVVRSVSDNPTLMIGLYDELLNKRIECYLSQDRAEEAREVWRKRVRVFGMVKRNPDTGVAVDLRSVTRVEVLEDYVAGAFMRARGALGWEEGDESPESIIRQLRDGE